MASSSHSQEATRLAPKTNPLSQFEASERIESDAAADRRVLIPYTSPRRFILGPVLKTLRIDDPQTFPLSTEEPPMFRRPSGLAFFNSKLRNWPSVHDDYLEWLGRMEAKYAYHWRQVGIYDLVTMSRYPIDFSGNLFGAAIQFWSKTINAFVFRFGIMTITIYDLAVMFNLPASGAIVSSNLLSTETSFASGLGRTELSWGSFIKTYDSKSTDPNQEEHVAFLLFWLCKYGLCCGSGKVTKEHIALATLLSEPTSRLALAPYWLSHIYRGLHQLIPAFKDKVQTYKNTGGPLWMVQLWLMLYFPEFCTMSRPPPTDLCDCYGHWVVSWQLHDNAIRRLIKFFHFTTTRSFDKFHPLFPAAYGPDWAKVDSDEYQVPYGQAVSWTYNWTSCLIARDLQFGTGFGPNNKTGAEQYCPNFAARQFGMTQDCPFPLTWSVNNPPHSRPKYAYRNWVTEIDAVFARLRERNNVVEWDIHPDVTPLYEEWWRLVEALWFPTENVVVNENLVLDTFVPAIVQFADPDDRSSARSLKGIYRLSFFHIYVFIHSLFFRWCSRPQDPSS